MNKALLKKDLLHKSSVYADNINSYFISTHDRQINGNYTIKFYPESDNLFLILRSYSIYDTNITSE